MSSHEDSDSDAGSYVEDEPRPWFGYEPVLDSANDYHVQPWGKHKVVLWLEPQGLDSLDDDERNALFDDPAHWMALIKAVWKLLNRWEDGGHFQKALAQCLEEENIPQESSAEDAILIMGVNAHFYGHRRRHEREVADYAVITSELPWARVRFDGLDPNAPLAIGYAPKGTQPKDIFGENKAADVVTHESFQNWHRLKYRSLPGRQVDDSSTLDDTTTNETIPSLAETGFGLSSWQESFSLRESLVGLIFYNGPEET